MWGRIWLGGLMALYTVAMANSEAGRPGFIDRFNGLTVADWHVADYDFDHPAFDTDWRKDQVAIGNGLWLRLSPKSGARQGRGNSFVGASVRRRVASQFGRYEVVLQAARGAGLVLGFFTYTGPYYGTRHDEIDIEFLGKDTTRMHVAWFVDGALREYTVDLGFDAAERPRVYAFEWAQDHIRWFADGRLVFEHQARDGPVPQVPGRLFANIWAADQKIAAWSGRTHPGLTATAHVQCMAFQPLGTQAARCALPPEPPLERSTPLLHH